MPPSLRSFLVGLAARDGGVMPTLIALSVRAEQEAAHANEACAEAWRALAQALKDAANNIGLAAAQADELLRPTPNAPLPAD